MSYRISLAGLLGLWLLAVHAPRASAQSTQDTQDTQFYGGYLFGDHLLTQPLSGSNPRLDDNATFGARYTYHFTQQWGVQLGAGYSFGRAAHVTSGDSNLGLTTVDVDLQWIPFPDFELAGHRFVPYAVIGPGYAWANLDHAMFGLAGTSTVTVRDSNGVTGNAGLGVQYELTDRLFLGFEARYRYLSKLVGDFGQGLNTTETTVSVGYRF
jgi:opacity protein-like surface antigen